MLEPHHLKKMEAVSMTDITCLADHAREQLDLHAPHGARPVRLIITMIKWIWTSRLAIKNSLADHAREQLDLHAPRGTPEEEQLLATSFGFLLAVTGVDRW